MEALSKVIPKKVKIGDYTIQKTLGSGAFGKVKVGQQKTSGNYVAVKIMKKGDIIKMKQADHVCNEIKILTMLEHPFLV